jgi:hypothetical protein
MNTHTPTYACTCRIYVFISSCVGCFVCIHVLVTGTLLHTAYQNKCNVNQTKSDLDLITSEDKSKIYSGTD